MSTAEAHVLYVETSDRHGTSSIVAVFTDAAAAERAVEQAEHCCNRRAFIRTVPCDPAELPRVLGMEYRRRAS